jgi:hypothetical protein
MIRDTAFVTGAAAFLVGLAWYTVPGAIIAGGLVLMIGAIVWKERGQ